MLILSRKKGEAISVGRDIDIKILEVSNDRVVLGIDAPVSVKILRTELYEEIINENRQAIGQYHQIPEGLK
ncbi:MAG: carbon storage regulator CsrA [Thermoanaerobacterales bacterium]|nr:carbon storage regulator CsrA [Thermoanaerobacterales bacterium]